ncbi:uncharacterized protein LOC120298525 [Crotalus tigris]|uniref:uncharacterized protein LOC120298525 n=1 Tax=Crotalus tigris TaxID=88082 RepID=UPI00192F5115|nr:uncharacterized protein LOC120298525 [Crotalus tigris]
MAEGTQGAALVEGEMAADGPADTVPVLEPAAAQPVVRPKLLLPAIPGLDEGEARAAKPQEEWWQSPAVTGMQTERLLTPKPKPSHSGWRERCATIEDDDDWSYSTAPGQETMDILRRRFGEASYRGAADMWQSEGDAAGRTPSSRFRLSSPRLRLPTGGPGAMGLPSSGSPGHARPAQPGGPKNVARGPARLGGVEQQSLAAGYPNLVPGQPQGPWGPGYPWGVPPIPVTFDGNPDELAMFLGQAISHLDQFAQLYVSQWAMVGAITAALRGEAAAWAADLYSDHARELGSAGLFLDALHGRFEDPTRAQRAEADLLALQQGNRPAIEYVREFRKLAGRLQSSWPERMLVHQFRAGLDQDLRQACVYRGVPNRLRDWFRVGVELETGLKAVYRGIGDAPRPRRTGERPRKGSQDQQGTTPKPLGASGGGGFRCFRCDQPGHRAADCPAPSPRKAATVGRATPMKKATEKSRAVIQPPAPGAKTGSPAMVESTAMARYQTGDEEDGSDDRVGDPMVSDPISPFVLPIILTSPVTGAKKACQALIDTGCTRCLMSRKVAVDSGFRIYPLPQPIRFEQVDGSLLGGVPATHVTEQVRMDLGDHWEVLRFIVIPITTETVILGLSWLDKWTPTIWWEEGYRKMRLGMGPIPRTGGNGGQVPDAPETTAQLQERGGEVSYPEEYRDLAMVFSEEECNHLPPHRPTDCAIELLPGVKLPKPRMYAMTLPELQELRRYIDHNLARGFIQPARSRIAAPVLFKEKKDGSLRLCVDFRGLNAVCVEHVYPLPLMKDLLAHLGTGRIYTKLDLREAYYRVRIRAGDEWKTAFNCPLGSFQFRVMPFGLRGAPAVFMQLINQVLHEHLYRGVLVYLDDILIYTATREEHVSLVRQVLRKLLEAQLYVKLSKCEFHRERLDYLGYRISGAGVEMDPSKVQAVQEWQAPQTRRQLQSFLGFANFYRQFIPSFAAVVHPLTELLRTKHLTARARPSQRIEWTMSCQKAFETLKTLFAKEPVLRHPDQSAPFVVQVDASDVAVGAVLLQKNSGGVLQPCAYTSRKFTAAECSWAVWEKEAFAIRWALATWRHLLEGAKQPFEVWTDHKNLEALQTPRRLAPKHVRWAQYFNRFQFTLKYVPGGKNFLADALSRMPQYHSKREEVIQALMPPSRYETARTVSHRSQVSELEAMRTALLTDTWAKEHSGWLTTRDGALYSMQRPAISATIVAVVYSTHLPAPWQT